MEQLTNGQLNSNSWTKSNNGINKYWISFSNRLLFPMEAMAMEKTGKPQ